MRHHGERRNIEFVYGIIRPGQRSYVLGTHITVTIARRPSYIKEYNVLKTRSPARR